MPDIYVLRDDQQFGPYGEETIALMLAEGQFSSSDYFWHDGMTEWRPLSELSPVSSNTAPQPKKSYPPVQKPTRPSLTPASIVELKSENELRSGLFREVSPGWYWIIGGFLGFVIAFFGFAPGAYGSGGYYPSGDFTPGEFRGVKRFFGCVGAAAIFFYGIFVVVGGNKNKK
jgi:hypothetical protein